MRINDYNPFSNAPQADKAGQTSGVHSGGGTGRTPNAGADGGDRVDLSGLAGLLSQTFHADSENRAARVSQLELEIRSGRYHVDAMAVSRAMIDDAIALGGDTA